MNGFAAYVDWACVADLMGQWICFVAYVNAGTEMSRIAGKTDQAPHG